MAIADLPEDIDATSALQADGLVLPARSGFLPQRSIHLDLTAAPRTPVAPLPRQWSAAQWRRAAPLLRAEGYTHVRWTGTDRLAPSELVEWLAVARAEGLRVALVDQGARAAGLPMSVLGRLDSLAIRFDGPAELHDRRHATAGAFDAASAALGQIAQRGVRVAAELGLAPVLHAELPHLAEHLLARGAQGLRVCPRQTAYGQPAYGQTPYGQPPHGDDDLLRLYLAVRTLQQRWHPRLPVHGTVDLARALWHQRPSYAALLSHQPRSSGAWQLSDLVNPLVIDHGGVMRPLDAALARCHDIGTVEQLGDEWLGRWALVRLPALQSLVAATLAELRTHHGVVDWWGLLAQRSVQRLMQAHALAA